MTFTEDLIREFVRQTVTGALLLLPASERRAMLQTLFEGAPEPKRFSARDTFGTQLYDATTDGKLRLVDVPPGEVFTEFAPQDATAAELRELEEWWRHFSARVFPETIEMLQAAIAAAAAERGKT